MDDMIVPKEKPCLEKINGYYLKLEKFISYMQQEVGTGCIHCKSRISSWQIYFSDVEIIRCVMRESGRPTCFSRELDTVIEDFRQKPYTVSVHYLDPNAVYFWEKLPAYEQSGKKADIDVDLFLNLIERRKQKRFSGFFDIDLESNQGGLLFLEKGELQGGSYSWGRGGLSPWENDYQQLISLLGDQRGILSVGRFIGSRAGGPGREFGLPM